MENKVSVIIPTYNRALHLQKAIDSVRTQSYRNFELIVIDDGSDDSTSEVIDKYAGDIKYFRQENRGPAAARNRGIEVADGDLLAFLDSDDRFAGDKLETQLKAMNRNPEFLISHTNEIWFRNGRILNQKLKHTKNGGDIFRRSLELCAVGMSTVIVRREVFEMYGLFDEEYPCCEDYEFWLRISAVEKFLFIDKPLTLKDGGRNDQVSTQFRVGMDKYRIQAIMKTLASGKLSQEQTLYAMDELKRKCGIYGNGCLKHGKAAEGRYYLGLPETIGKGLGR